MLHCEVTAGRRLSFWMMITGYNLNLMSKWCNRCKVGWSSTSAHLAGKDDLIVKVAPLLEMADNWKDILHSGVEDQRFQEMRHHEGTGRPLGSESFVEGIENALGRCLRRGKPGPKPKSKQN